MKLLQAVFSICVAVFSLFICIAAQAEDDGFTPLFDGKTLDGWVTLDDQPIRKGWEVVDGMIHLKVGKERAGYIKTTRHFENFELKFEWRIAQGGNSGVKYRAKNSQSKFGRRYFGCEFQLLDDQKHKNGRNALTSAGALYGLYAPNTDQKELRPVGEFNQSKIVVDSDHVEHWLNGKKILEANIGSEDWHNRVSKSKVSSVKEFATGPGVILLQEHLSEVWFRNIRIKSLAPAENSPVSLAVDKPGPVKPRENQKPQTRKPGPKKKRPTEVGPAIGGNKATPIDRIKAAKGFQVELLYSVPGKEQGSWVNLCTDNKGRILVSDQFGGMYRITPPPAGKVIDPAAVEKVPADIRAVNGMVWAFGALYVGVNDYERKIPSGLYRITDSDGDDQLDKVELLQEVQSKSDHGVHALMPTPDGKALYLITGNNTIPPKLADSSPVRQVWGEDHLLPSMPDGRGHNRGVLAPGGIVYRVSPDGKKFEAFASGFRNIFDAAVNRDGELFTYDADMEYDFNTPWYRPTRICHVVSGAEFGWRNGAGKRMPFYADNLPAVLDIGPGSPTGMTFGYGSKFPSKYQDALYALDWSWGKLYAVHLEQSGSSYKATKEEFVTGAPLPITDAIIRPQDGAMYFTIGGRRVQSGLYRVTYVGKEPTDPVRPTTIENKAVNIRRTLEAYHGKQDPDAIKVAWPYLADQDRFIRFAARTAIEHQPVGTWAEKALTESDPAKQVEALLALARVTGVCPQHRTDDTPEINTAMRDKLLGAVIAIDALALDEPQLLTLQRATQVILNRFGRPDQGTVKQLIASFEPLFPAKSPELNWLLCETLAWLESPTVAEKAMALINAAPTQEEQMQYARSIRMLKAGWTLELRTAYFEWFLKAANYKGGASFDKFIQFIRDDAVASLSKSDKASLEELLAKKPVKKSALENLGQVFEGRSVKKWTLDELSAAARTELAKRDFANGRRMFAASGCYACHRFGNQGGMTGPDLTSAGRRYSAHDLLDQVINPSKVINEQFSAITVVTEAGLTHTGVVVNLNGDSMTINTDLTDPNKRVSIDRKQIDELFVSEISPMPAGLFNQMTKDEILDLIAYLISGGDSNHEFFKK